MRMSIGVRRWHCRAGWRLSPSPDAQQAGRGGDGPKEGERVRRVAAAGCLMRVCVSASLLLCVSLNPSVPAVCPGASFVRERERERELGVCACVGWVALVVDDRPVWDWGTSAWVV